MSNPVHPKIIEAARAIADSAGEPQCYVAHIQGALAAARVLLSIEPTDEIMDAFRAASREEYRAALAELRKELGI